MSIKTLYLKASEWLTPDHEEWTGESGLCVLANDAKGIDNAPMCCLGILAHSLGTHKEDLMGLCFPSGINEDFRVNYPSRLMELEGTIAGINDDVSLTVEERLEALQGYFTEVDYNLVYLEDE